MMCIRLAEIDRSLNQRQPTSACCWRALFVPMFRGFAAAGPLSRRIDDENPGVRIPGQKDSDSDSCILSSLALIGSANAAFIRFVRRDFCRAAAFLLIAFFLL